MIDTLLAWKNAGFSEKAAAGKVGLSRSTFRDRLTKARRWLRSKEGEEFAKKHNFNSKITAPEIQLRHVTAQLRETEHRLAAIEDEKLRTDQVRQYIFGLSEHQPKPPPWINDRRGFSYHHGIPTLFLSDIHYGEVVHPAEIFNANEYNAKIAIQRVHRIIDTTIHLTHGILKEPKFPGIVLALGGDNINGALRDESLASNDRPIMRQAIEVADLLHASILKLIGTYKRVFVVGVPGNHGRGTIKPWAGFYAETNLDWLVYQMIERFMGREIAAGQVSFCTPPARDVTFRVAGRSFRLTHGDQFRGGDSIIGPLGPITRGDNKKRAMALSLPTADEEYDTLLVAHFHRLMQDGSLIINGSVIGYNAYALQNNFKYEPPQQSLFLTHEKYGINHMMPVLADEPKKIFGKPAPWAEFRGNQ